MTDTPSAFRPPNQITFRRALFHLLLYMFFFKLEVYFNYLHSPLLPPPFFSTFLTTIRGIVQPFFLLMFFKITSLILSICEVYWLLSQAWVFSLLQGIFTLTLVISPKPDHCGQVYNSF